MASIANSDAIEGLRNWFCQLSKPNQDNPNQPESGQAKSDQNNSSQTESGPAKSGQDQAKTAPTKLVLSSIDLELASALAYTVARGIEPLIERYQVVSLFLKGNLGAGKTTFCQTLVAALSGSEIESIESPTYAYLIPYCHQNLGWTIQHFDLYRVNSASHFISLGLDEGWQVKSLNLIEWPEKVEGIAPWPRIELEISYETALLRSWEFRWFLAKEDCDKQ